MSIGKLYEPVNERYRIVSIPVVLRYLEEQSDSLQFEYRAFVIDKLSATVFRRDALEAMTDHALSRTLVAYFRSELPDISRAKFHAASLALAGIRKRRDKVIAHNEQVDRNALPQGTLDEADTLVVFAEDIVTIVAQGYLGLIFELQGGERRFFQQDATRAVRALGRLLDEMATVSRPRRRGASGRGG